MKAAENYTTKNALLHHGILGQKWGVTNGPPYPLDDSVSTGKKIKTVNTKPYSSSTKRIHNKNINKLQSSYSNIISSVDDTNPYYKEHKDIMIQKRDYAVKYQLASSAKVRKNYEEKFAVCEYMDANISGYTQNCAYCSINYILKRLGYDQFYVPYNNDGLYHDKFVDYFTPDLTDAAFVLHTKTKSPQDLWEELLVYAAKAPGAYGFLSVYYGDVAEDGSYMYSGGHSIAFECIDGDLYIIDAQAGRRIKSVGNFRYDMISLYGSSTGALMAKSIISARATDISHRKPDIEKMKEDGIIWTKEQSDEYHEYVVNRNEQAKVANDAKWDKRLEPLNSYYSQYVKNGYLLDERSRQVISQYLMRNYKLSDAKFVNNEAIIEVTKPYSNEHVTTLKLPVKKNAALLEWE